MLHTSSLPPHCPAVHWQPTVSGHQKRKTSLSTGGPHLRKVNGEASRKSEVAVTCVYHLTILAVLILQWQLEPLVSDEEVFQLMAMSINNGASGLIKTIS